MKMSTALAANIAEIVKKIFYDGFEIFKINLRYSPIPHKVKPELIAVCSTTFFICNKSSPGECLNLFAFNLLRYCILNGINFVVLSSVHFGLGTHTQHVQTSRPYDTYTYIGLSVL